MFRSLKQKLGDSLANSPARNLLSVDQAKQVSASVFFGCCEDQATPAITGSGMRSSMSSSISSVKVSGGGEEVGYRKGA